MSDVPLIKQFLQHQSRFMAYLVAITRDIAAAEEIFQNAAVVVMEKSSTDDKVRDFHPWAKEIVRRQALSFMQKKIRSDRRVRPVEPVLLEQITRTFVDDQTVDSIADRESLALRACIAKLDSAERVMLEQRYTRRLSFDDIGESIGKTAGAVQRSISRIRKRLHDCVLGKIKLAEARL